MASSQLILDKTCLNDYGFAPDICDDLQHHDANNTVVQVFLLISILSPVVDLRMLWPNSAFTRA